MNSQTSGRVPPHTANIGQACYKCFASDSSANLRKCSKCFRVAYCGTDCQKADWAHHKAICKVFDVMEKIPLPAEYPNILSLDPDETNKSVDAKAKMDVTFCRVSLGRELNTLEKNILGWEPRCMACGCTDRNLRQEAARHGSPRRSLIPCSACHLTFYCCTAHQEALQDLHISTGSPEEPSQCQVNKNILADIRFSNFMAEGGMGPFHWAPERTKGSWSSVKQLGWMSEFGVELRTHFKLPELLPLEPWVNNASVALSMPMSILWALETLNGADEGWTRKKVLTIHIMGAFQVEVSNGQIFEEILHRLPEVETLNLILCGPELSDISSSLSSGQAFDMDTCPECQRKDRKRLHSHYSETYHDFMRSDGATLPKPDLAVAFNSGASEMDILSWQETMQYLVQNHIPSLFTAYNQVEAQGEAELLAQAGARLVFGPAKNPWGSSLMRPEPMKISGFYAVNQWIAGIFGR